jgi:hypothetical protein
LDRALTLDFSYRPALFGSALVALEQGRPLPLQRALTRWAAIVGAPMTVLGELSQAMIDFRETGVPSPVEASLQQLDAGQELIGSGTLASIHALVGAREGMLRWLRAAVADGSWAEEYLVVNPAYDPYRDDPGFRSILEEIGDIG